MFDWRFAGLAMALIVLYPLGGAAQTPHEPLADAPRAAQAGPGIDTREPQTGPEASDAPTVAPASDEAAPAQPEHAAEPVSAEGRDDVQPAAPIPTEDETARQKSRAAPSPAPEEKLAPRETAPVAQPLAPAPSPDAQSAPKEQVAEPAPVEPPRQPEDIAITLATWQSAYNEAQKRAILEPFGEDTGYKLDIVSHGGDFDGLNAARLAQTGWDLIELNAQAAARGCSEGWLASIAPADLPDSVEGDPAEDDYLPGALLPCAAASAAWSAVTVYDSRAAFDNAPERIADLFDLPRFPGKRVFPSQAPYLLELALMADGVAPEKVYGVLATPAGQDRAFAKLSSIRHAIVWWDDPAAALAMFRAGAPESAADVVMGIAFNGRVFTDVVRARGALKILWDAQVYQFNYWGVPTDAAEPDAARELLRALSLPERQARLTQWFPYGPPRKSALPLVGRHAEIDLDMAAFVPTMPGNMQGALRFDPAWWSAHGDALKRRFADWLALPAPSAPADQFIPPTPIRADRDQARVTVQ